MKTVVLIFSVGVVFALLVLLRGQNGAFLLQG